MNRLFIMSFLCLGSVTGCKVDMSRYSLSMSDDTAYWPRDYEWDGPPGSEGNPPYHGDVDIDLSAGYLSSSGVFEQTLPDLYLDPAGDWAFLQIGAELKKTAAYDLDLVRVSFTSNRVEWICGEPSGSWIFLSQQACEDAGYYCDPVVAGEGESGVFDAGSGAQMSVINAHCTHAGLPYTYTVEAYAYDYSAWNPVVISKIASIDVHCREQ